MPSKASATITVKFHTLFTSRRLSMVLVYYRVGGWHNFILAIGLRTYGMIVRRWQIGFDIL